MSNHKKTSPTVRALGQKYKTAELALKVTVPAFQGLTGSVGDPSWIGEWEKLEMKAAKKRGEAMMIYNVSPVPGPFSLFWWCLFFANFYLQQNHRQKNGTKYWPRHYQKMQMSKCGGFGLECRLNLSSE